MKPKSLLALIMLFCVVNVFGQKLSIDLSFTAVNKADFVQLDSIKVMNRSQGGESILYYPDTTLSVEITPGDTLLYIGYTTGYPVGVQEINQENSSFQLYYGYPNPVKDHCIISMYIPVNETVSLIVNDIQGRVIISIVRKMDKGIHYFKFTPGNSSLYFLSARCKEIKQSIKIVNAEPNTGKRCRLDYEGSSNNAHFLKASFQKYDLVMQESGILDSPNANETFTFQFATNIPCPGTPTVTYEGQVYNTIQIFSQCWLKENLNVGTMINGSQEQTNNGIKEKYCYNNQPDSCTKYGGLYQWDEMMQYNTQQGTQGLCPVDWHIPTDEEWKVLDGSVDSQYGIGSSEWDGIAPAGFGRGFDAGTNLKTTSGWLTIGNGTDLFGFSGLPGGMRSTPYGTFLSNYSYGYWWTSTSYELFNDHAWHQCLLWAYLEILRESSDKVKGYSVRCIRDY
jgi:uncharacterized protein (TIGR02145 family)